MDEKNTADDSVSGDFFYLALPQPKSLCMDNPIHIQYLAISRTDLNWGMTTNSVGFQSIAPGMAYPPDVHPSRYLFSTKQGRILNEYQLLYITRGKGRFTSGSLGAGRFVPVCEGNMFLLFPGEWHNYMPDGETGWDEYWIGFQGSHIDYWMANSFFHREKPVYNVGIHSRIVDLYREAIQAAADQKSGFQQVLAGIVNHLLGLAYSYDRNSVFDTSQILMQISRAKTLVTERFRDISPEEIAAELHMSYSNFRKIFREYTGFAPAQYILEVRLSKSKELLANTSVPIREIAGMTGFENYEYFFTAFKKKTGTTPMAFRQLAQGNFPIVE